jgi:dihydrofolate reductase
MARITTFTHITLDGVMQAPGRPDEDTRGGFRHGGWATSRTDDVMQEVVAQRVAKPDRSWLFGRRTYDLLLQSWNEQGGPYKDALNNAPKYVVSSNPAKELRWPNSMLVHGDIPAALGDLKRRSRGDLVIMGSGELIRSLLPYNLVDEYLLMIHPLVLGSGRRLFGCDEHVQQFRLNESTVNTKGVILASYDPVADGAP